MAEIQWRGVIAPLHTPDAVGRTIKMAGAPKTRKLPLPLRYQPADWGAHTGAVQVGSIERVWIDGKELWGEGRFMDDDEQAFQVMRKIRNGFVRHISADIEPGTDKLMAATIVDIPAFEQAEIKYVSMPEPQLEEEPELVAFAFRVVGDMGLPIGDRERAWDSSAAEKRVAAWAGGDDFDPNKYRRAFLYQDEDSDPKLKGSYKLPFADVVDGTLTAIPRAVFAVAGVLQGSRGGVSIPESDQATIKNRVTALYRKMAKKFNDPSITPPWDKSNSYADVVSQVFSVNEVDDLRRCADVAYLRYVQAGV